MKHAIIADPYPLLCQSIEEQLKASHSFQRICRYNLLDTCVLQPQEATLWVVDQALLAKQAASPDVWRYRKSSLLVTGHAVEPKLLRKLFKQGAQGFILKSAPPLSWQKAVISLLNGRRYVYDPAREEVESLLFNQLMGVDVAEPALTRREKEVLALIVQEYTTREIAAHLSIGNSTVETHRLRLLQKLHVKNTAGLVREAMKHSLVPLHQ